MIASTKILDGQTVIPDQRWAAHEAYGCIATGIYTRGMYLEYELSYRPLVHIGSRVPHIILSLRGLD